MKYLLVTAVVLLAAFMVGCESNNTAVHTAPQTNRVVTEPVQSESFTPTETTVSSETEPMTAEIDMDLTKLDKTMLYAQLYLILSEPEDYLGQTIKMRGTMMVIPGETPDVNYFLANVYDETACCQIGMEFIWAGEHSYPENYPPESTEVEICGEFGSYDEDGKTYYYILTEELMAIL